MTTEVTKLSLLSAMATQLKTLDFYFQENKNPGQIRETIL